MFKPKTEKIEKLAKQYPEIITKLESIFSGKTNIYIDYANVAYWQGKLGWRFDIKRLKRFLDSFDNISAVKIYYGTLDGDKRSEELMNAFAKYKYDVKTKPVKIMRWYIDVSSIEANSPAILRDFISKPLLRKFKLETIEYLNQQLKELNDQGMKYIEVRKCNFDVEIGRDMLLDFERNGVDTFVLWSGDSDFADPISQLISDKKNVHIFATARRISRELSETGVQMLDIKKIKEFICRNKDL
jgi:uncharacterized LabA/DUF88 family protein